MNNFQGSSGETGGAYHLLPAKAISLLANFLLVNSTEDLPDSTDAPWRSKPSHLHVNDALRVIFEYLSGGEDSLLCEALASLSFAVEIRNKESEYSDPTTGLDAQTIWDKIVAEEDAAKASIGPNDAGIQYSPLDIARAAEKARCAIFAPVLPSEDIGFVPTCDETEPPWGTRILDEIQALRSDPWYAANAKLCAEVIDTGNCPF